MPFYIAKSRCASFLSTLFSTLLLTCQAMAQDGQALSGPHPAARPVALMPQPAEITSAATSAMILSAAKAGKRIVAVGDHGIVLLSDDDGVNFRQAKSVPVRSTLTAVTFVDGKNGWAAGHWGVVLKTGDAGETWDVQRSDTSVDQPLFSVYFKDKNVGWAAGLWSLMLATKDGGKTWIATKIPAPPNGGKADRNLFQIFANSKGILFVAAEQGTVLRSDDNGASWSYLSTGYKGTFWAGIALNDGTILVGGLRGTIYRSSDDGQSWQASESSTKSSITDFEVMPGKIVACGLDGTVLESIDDGRTFKSSQREDRLTLTAVIVTDAKKLVFFSKLGPVTGKLR